MIYLHIYTIDKDIKVKSKQLLHNNLCSYLKNDDFIINKNKNGKPSTQGISFSVSHSKTKLVQAFCFDGEIGVDVEFKNKKRHMLKLAKRYFNQQEYMALKGLSTSSLVTMFYCLWTAKEAVCKVQGGRLWFYLKENYLNSNQHFKTKIRDLKLIRIDDINDYSLTVATENHDNEIQLIYARNKLR